ncbi:CHAT domain-containing protein [Micromonospora sp. CPCC 205539]|uniref:CHAT domain-containing protein n=1 Tax=Micromonospora sp. CPCC 205539 TaxID=3122408 RepID=UPI002FF34D17
MFRRRQPPAANDDRVGFALREIRGRLAQYHESGRVAELDEAVAAGVHALALCAADAPQRPAALLVLGEARGLRFEHTDSRDDLAACVEVYRELAGLAPSEQPDLTGFALHAFATRSLQLGLLTGARPPVEQALLAARELNDLGLSTGVPELHAAAAAIFQQGVLLLPADHPDRAGLAALRGAALIQWTVNTGDLSRLAEATEEVERAVRLCAVDDPNRRPFLALLTDVRRLAYESTGTREALDGMLRSIRDALDLYASGHPVSMTLRFNLGLLHRDRYRLSGDLADLDTAAQQLRLVAAQASDPSIRESAHQALTEVTELGGPPPPVDLPPGLTFVAGPGSRPQRTAAEAGDDLAELARHSTALADLLSEYERTGDLALLERIRDDGHTLLARLPAGHPVRALIGIALGPALMRRFEAYGEAADLDESVDLLRAAVERPALSPTHVIGELVNLAAALINRFLRDRGGADLDEAIVLCRRAIELTPAAEPSHARYLLILGTALVYRFQHTDRRFDLDEAIEVGQAALAAAADETTATRARANLGNRLRQRFLTGRAPGDLDAAVTHLRAALATADDPAVRLNLALALRDRGPERRADLLDAVDEYQRVLGAVPPRSPLHLTARLGLAQVLADLGRPEEGIAALDGIAEEAADRSFERMDALVLLAGLRAALASEGRGEWGPAARAYDDAVQHLHRTVWRGLGGADREQLVRRWGAVASDAAAAAISAGLPERAVELLDHGRSLWWGQVLDSRSEVTALATAHPALAERLTALRDDERAWSDGPGQAQRRRDLAREWDDLVAAVRARPGFASFLQPTPFAELAEVATDGPVVLVNVSGYRCDALILTARGVQLVPLPDLSAAQADERTGRYLDVVTRVGVGGLSAGPREQVLLAYLEWLWDVVAAPVLAAVPPSVTRLWWCPTGPLALAPLHAAGYHDPDDAPAGRSVLDRVVSSSTATLRSLRYARRPAVVGEHRPLVVACAERPSYVTGLPDLPAAAREAELLRSRFPAATVLTGPAATRARVTAELAGRSSAHFACHGDATAAGQPALFLADAPLTLTDVARLDLSGAQLAVLSACHTGRGGADLPDEAGHLAAALQVAGFRHVVSTLWAIGDHAAATVTDRLYDGLSGTDGTLDPSRSADALHAVTRALRATDPFRPSRWAPFVHHGQ